MPYATGNQLAIYYEVHGEQGSPLLMIGGWTDTIANWLPAQLQQLSRQHQVIIFDNRGAGQSDKPTTPYTMADFAADAVSVLDAAGVKQAHLFGVSMGGMIAQHVALNYPARVCGLILGCTQAGYVDHPQIIPVPEALLASLSTADGTESSTEPAPTLQTTYPGCTPEDQDRQYAAINTHDTFDRLPTLRLPTLIQTGAIDIISYTENAQVLAQLIPGAKLITYENCGHEYFTQSGIQALQDILDFLYAVDQSKSQTN